MADHPTTRPDRQPTTPATDQPTTSGRSVGADRARLIPPVAALGTAWVMQVVAITDTVGEALAKALVGSPMRGLADHAWLGYLFALLLGVAVASCAEGGAAYLMDLYDKHLLAQDSTWALRLAMCIYVAVSAGAIHWWTHHRGLPDITSWLLAGMSASALFLWSRGSRWRNRVAMRKAGQLDPAMPKLPAAAKFWHPIRSLHTARLVSWEPAVTPDEARARYEEWRAARSARKGVAKPTDRKATKRPTAQPTEADRVAPAAPTQPATRKTATAMPTGRPTAPALHVVGPSAAVVNARLLRERYGDQLPTSMRQIRSDTGWSKERVDKAVEKYRAGADREPAADDEEREQVVAS